MQDMLLPRSLLVGLLVLLSMFSSGCSLRKVGYGLAAKYVSQRLIDTFAIEGRDKIVAERAIRDIHKWHRQSELPRYVTLIDGLTDRLRDGMSDDDFRWLQQQGDEAMARLADKFAPPAADVLSRLREDQLVAAERNLAKSEKERFDKLDQSDEKYFAYRLDNTKKTLKTWLGSYSDEQLQIFAAFHREDRDEERKRREAMRANRAQLLQAVRSKQDKQELSAMIVHWMTTRQTAPTPDYQQNEQRQEQRYARLLQQVDRTLSVKQRQHLIAELAAWKQDFVALQAE